MTLQIACEWVVRLMRRFGRVDSPQGAGPGPVERAAVLEAVEAEPLSATGGAVR